MIVQCEKCETRFRLDPERLPQAKLRVRCFRCQHTFDVQLSGEEGLAVADEVAATPTAEPEARVDATDDWEGIAAEDAFSFDDWAADLASELATDSSHSPAPEPADPEPLELALDLDPVELDPVELDSVDLDAPEPDPVDSDPLGSVPDLADPAADLGLDLAGPDPDPDPEPGPELAASSGPPSFSSDTERLVPASSGAFEVDFEDEPEATAEAADVALADGREAWASDEPSPDLDDPLRDLFEEPPAEPGPPAPHAADPGLEQAPESPPAPALPEQDLESLPSAEPSTHVWDYSGAGPAAASEPVEAEAPAPQPLLREPSPPPAVQSLSLPRAPEEPAALARSLFGPTPQARLGAAAVLVLGVVILAGGMLLEHAPARAGGELAIEGWVARELRGRWIENTLAGPLFLVSGTLTNASDRALGPGRLRVVLLDGQGAPLPGASAPIGPPLGRERLRMEEPASLRVEQAGSPSSRAVDPGGALPFEAFFSDVPSGGERFVLVTGTR